MRASDDFFPRDPASHTIHIASVAYNTLFVGEFMQPDWDMFHVSLTSFHHLIFPSDIQDFHNFFSSFSHARAYIQWPNTMELLVLWEDVRFMSGETLELDHPFCWLVFDSNQLEHVISYIGYFVLIITVINLDSMTLIC